MGRFVSWLLLAACSASPGPDVVIERVVPGSGPNTEVTPVRIEGSGFRLPVVSDLDDGRTMVGTVAIGIGDAPLAEVAWRGEQLIEATVPADLAEGSHDVTVMLGERSAVLPDGYVVTSGSWSTPVPVRLDTVSSVETDSAATTDAAQQRLIFWSTRAGGAGGADLYEATWTGTEWGPPQRLVELASPANDYDPFFTTDALAVYFDSDRSGGAGAQDLYLAKRPTLADPFAAPVPLAELSSPARDMDPWLTPDQRTMVFASNRSGEYVVYVTTR